MKSENSIILNSNKSDIIFNILKNTFLNKGDFYLFFDIDILENRFLEVTYDEEVYKIFSAKYVLDNFNVFLRYINSTTTDFIFSIFDDFSSYVKMYKDFELTGDSFCYSFIFYDNIKYNMISQIPDDIIDVYYFMNNAYTLDICTILKDGECSIFENISQMLGFNQKNDFNTTQKNTYINLLDNS